MVLLKDIVPAATNTINTKFIFLEKGNVAHDGKETTCMALVADETASVHFQLWGDECHAFEPGDIIHLTSGIFSYHKSSLVLRAGKKGKVEKVGEFSLLFVETPNMSEILWARDPNNPKNFLQESVISPHSRIFPPLFEHCRSGKIGQAQELFDRMVAVGYQPDVKTYTTLIAGCCRQKRMEVSEKLLSDCFKLGLKPTKQTYTSLICGYCRDDKTQSAWRIFEKMIQEGCMPDSVTYGALISGLCKESRLDEARALYESMLDKGLVPCEVTRISLAFELLKKEKLKIAMLVLGRLEKKHFIHAASILVRKLSSVGNVDAVF